MTDAKRYVLDRVPVAYLLYDSDKGTFTIQQAMKAEGMGSPEREPLSTPWQSESMAWHEAAMKLGYVAPVPS